MYTEVHADISVGLEPKQPTPQKPGAGSLEQSWDKNTDLLKHSPVGYTQNISFAITVRQGTVFCHSF